jgi:hypothetical protein
VVRGRDKRKKREGGKRERGRKGELAAWKRHIERAVLWHGRDERLAVAIGCRGTGQGRPKATARVFAQYQLMEKVDSVQKELHR